MLYRIILQYLSITRNLTQNPNFGQKSKFLIKHRMVKMDKTSNGQKSNFLSKIEIFIKHPNFAHKSKFWSQIESLFKIEI